MERNILKQSGFENSLNRVLNVRLQRKKIYGDSWKSNSDWELLAYIKQKCGRLEDLIINKKINTYENEIDTLIDLINYSLFLLENKLETQNENINKK